MGLHGGGRVFVIVPIGSSTRPCIVPVATEPSHALLTVVQTVY
jgi:hypothetical protein